MIVIGYLSDHFAPNVSERRAPSMRNRQSLTDIFSLCLQCCLQQRKYFPFTFSCVLWFFYGIAISDKTTIFINVVGFLISMYAMCLLCGILPTDKRSLVILGVQTFATIAILVWVLWYVQCGTQGNDSLLGMIACGGSLLALGWPLLQYSHGEGTVESLNNGVKKNGLKAFSGAVLLRASPELAAFASSVSWALYGTTLDFNMNIILPNIISALFSIMQLFRPKDGRLVRVDPSACEISSATKATEANDAADEMHIIQMPYTVEIRPQTISVGVR